jgi:predicted PurR-regulated permease PerM
MSAPQGSSGAAFDRLATDRAKGIMLFVVTVWAAGAALIHAQPILAPVCFALVVGIVISPVADRLHDLGVPRVVIAGGLMVLASGLLLLAFILIEPLLSTLAFRLPEIRAEIEGWVDTLSFVLRGLEDLSDEIEATVGEGGGGGAEVNDGPDLPTVMDAIWLVPNIGAKLLIFAGTLFFFVLTRSDLYDAAGPLKAELYRADRAVARYFAAVTIVNFGLGAATAAVLSLIGLDYAVLWGLAAAVMNFVLYLGPLGIAVSLLVAGLVQFSGLLALAPALAFLALNLTEAQFVTPAFVGQRLRIAPLAVFLAIVLGLWLWGPVGAIVALPVTLWFGVLIEGRRAGRTAAEEARQAAGANESPAA